MLRSIARGWHAQLSRYPWLGKLYFAFLARLGPRLSFHRRQQMMNSLNTSPWTGLKLPPREVQLAAGTRVWLHPHPGEFDFEAVLGAGLSYEQEMFTFLDQHALNYDAFVDIGANVGALSLFMSQNLDGQGVVYAFEPSRTAFGRLLQNLERNSTTNVQAFNTAIGTQSGFALFTEPEGHLTNGSLVESFARFFSNSVKRTAVTVLDAAELASLLEGHQRVLIKIDTEGFEVQVLEALAPVLRTRQHDLIIEVLPEFEDTLNNISALHELGYKVASITPQGLVPTARMVASKWRNCFLSVHGNKHV